MKSIAWAALGMLATATVVWLSGCSERKETSSAAGTTGNPPAQAQKEAHKDHETGEHHEGEHKEGAHKHGGHTEAGHDDKPLTEKDVKMPASFKNGVARLEELNETIEHQIEHGELAKVHRVAEEMALVAKKMKELARHDLPEDRQTDAGRLCNEVAGYFVPIDEAADAGKKPETQAIHKKMAEAIGKLKALIQ